MVRALVIDEQAEMRQGLRMRLGVGPDLALIGETDKAEEAPHPSAGYLPAWATPAAVGKASAKRGLNLERNSDVRVLNSTASSDGSG